MAEAEAYASSLLGHNNIDYLPQNDVEQRILGEDVDMEAHHSHSDGAERQDLEIDHPQGHILPRSPQDEVLEHEGQALGFSEGAEHDRVESDDAIGAEKVSDLSEAQAEQASDTVDMAQVSVSGSRVLSDLVDTEAEILKDRDSVREDSRVSVAVAQGVALGSEDSVNPISERIEGFESNAEVGSEQGFGSISQEQFTVQSDLAETVSNLEDGAAEAEIKQAVEPQDLDLASGNPLKPDKTNPENSFAVAVEFACQNDLKKEETLGSSCVHAEEDGNQSLNSDLDEVNQEASSDVPVKDEPTNNKILDEKIGSEKVKTELEMEMELFEAAEASLSRDQAEPVIRNDEVHVVEEAKNERKRLLDDPGGDASLALPKKRGRRKGHGNSVSKGSSVAKEEDDVCFVCFDGGDLVLCDKRFCPKAYHTSCIGRDAAFFEKKGAWFCGWHFCCTCCRPASLQCYTCPRAFCTNCIKDADFLVLKKRKGLCEECLPIVNIIEGNGSQNANEVQVDFDDPDTYECLFKEYWKDLKSKFSLKFPSVGHGGIAIENVGESAEEPPSDTDEQSETEAGSADVDEEPEMSDCKTVGRKRKQNEGVAYAVVNEDHGSDYDETMESAEDADESLATGKNSEKLPPREFDGWASKDLLEFLTFMDQDPKIRLSRFQVNKLLWTYIKSNKLQNPKRRTIIECDERLRKLFGKKSMHQHEMMRDIHLHYPPKESVPKGSYVSKRRLKNAVSQKELQGDVQGTIDGITEKPDTVQPKDTQKSRRKSLAVEGSKTDGEEYAAINPQNVNLIYLRRALLEDLLDEPDFESKVVGTFVRIRVPSTNSKMDMCYRLVQVAGIKSQNQEYNTGRKMTKALLEIMNLHKKEELTIDLVSNQEFTEEECRRLRQSVKCHFIKAFTVGEVEKKALAIRQTKLNDWFETEILRVSALRDRANEKGRKKELRECVEKLQKLNDPEYRAKELQRSPVVVADPHMNPEYESEGDEEEPNNDGGEMSVGGDKWFGAGNVEKSSRSSGREKASLVHSWDRRNVEFTGPNKREWDAIKSPSSGWEKTRDRGMGYTGQEAQNGRQGPMPYKVEHSQWEDGKGEWGQSTAQELLPVMDDQRRIKGSQVNWGNDQEGWKGNDTNWGNDQEGWRGKDTWGTGGSPPNPSGWDNGQEGWTGKDAWAKGGTTPNSSGLGNGREEWRGKDSWVKRGTALSSSGWDHSQEGWNSSEAWPKGGNIPAISGGSGKLENSGWNKGGVMAAVVSSNQGWTLDHPLPPVPPPSVPAPPSSGFPVSALGNVNISTAEANEKEKVWHYKDPSGTVQGPFSMEQLKKWNLTGLFPLDLKIWKSNQPIEESILLTDALAGRFVIDRSTWASQAVVTHAPPTPSVPWVPHAGTPGISTPSPWVAQASTQVTSTPPAWGAQAASHGNSTPIPWGAQAGSNRTSVPSPWIAQPPSHGTSASLYEGDFKGRNLVMTQYGDSRQENDSNSMTDFVMETGKSNTWGRGPNVTQWGANQRPWGAGHNQGLGRGGGRSDWGQDSGRRFSSPGWNQQVEPARGPKKDIPCRFHQKGFCRRGDACIYRHD